MPERVAGYDEAQIANAAVIASVAAAWGMGEQGALLGIMCAMGESSLRNIDYGDWETNDVRNPDGTPTTSIGLFQQQTWWGSEADRMDPIYSSWKFFEALKKVSGWRDLEPTVAIHRVQINADPNHYAKYESAARAVLDAIPTLRAKGIIMADPMDIIEVPWQPGNYARRALVDAVARAGKPRGNSWGRLKDEQQRAWNAYQNGTGSPADNPNDPNNYELGHVRFAAVDIDYSPDTHRRLSEQGLVRPFSWESWHYRLPGDVRKWPIVTSIPSTASSDAQPFDPEEEDMSYENDAQLRARLDQIVAFIGDNFKGLTGKVGGEGDQTRKHIDVRISDLAGWTRDDANGIRQAISGLSVAGTDPAKIAAALAPLIPAGASAKEVADELGKRLINPS